jgi:hypothetical protein
MRQTRRHALTSLATVIVMIALMAAAKLHRQHVLNAPQGPNMPVPEPDTEQKDEDMPAPRHAE